MTDFTTSVPTAPKPPYDGVERPYSPADVEASRAVNIKHSLAENGRPTGLWS